MHALLGTAAALAAGSRDALRAAKALLRSGSEAPLEEQLAKEARSIAVLAGGTEAQGAMESFLAARSRARAAAERSADQESQSVS